MATRRSARDGRFFDTRTRGWKEWWREPVNRAACAGLMFLTILAPNARAQDFYIGQMMLVPYNFCPSGWASAEGQIVAISQNSTLFSLLGTTYGGDGVRTFALPDLRGRVPVGQGQGPGLYPINLGDVSGTESVVLLAQHLPQHTHELRASSQPATHAAPGSGRALATTQNAGSYAQGALDTPLAPGSIGVAGNNLPFSIRNPYLGMRWCIALTGIYPTRN